VNSISAYSYTFVAKFQQYTYFIYLTQCNIQGTVHPICIFWTENNCLRANYLHIGLWRLNLNRRRDKIGRSLLVICVALWGSLSIPLNRCWNVLDLDQYLEYHSGCHIWDLNCVHFFCTRNHALKACLIGSTVTVCIMS
jgi:hypothetical protein